MKAEASITKSMLTKVISEEITRLRKEFRKDLVMEGCGCRMDQGCCQDRGCCSDKSGCGDLFDMINDRVDILTDYIESHKEPIVNYFKSKGVELKS